MLMDRLLEQARRTQRLSHGLIDLNQADARD